MNYSLTITAESSRELLHKIESLYLDMTRDASAAKPIAETAPETPRRKFRVMISPYPDINTGDVGEMMDELPGACIALRFEKLFTQANNLERREMAKRIIAFDKKHVTEVTE